VVNLSPVFHIERGAHGVLNKNKISGKNFISLLSNYLPQKTSCGQGTIFARIVHIRAKGRGMIYMKENQKAGRSGSRASENQETRYSDNLVLCTLIPVFAFFYGVYSCSFVVKNGLTLFFKVAYGLRLKAHSCFDWRPVATTDMLLIYF
jgi:hypothetical protein